MKKAAPWVRPFRYFEATFQGAPCALKNRLSGGAKIVGRRFARAAIGHDFVRDLLAFTQRSEPGTFNSADVHEHVIAAVIRLAESIALHYVNQLPGSHPPAANPFYPIHFV